MADKGLVQKKAMEKADSDEEADVDDPDWEVDPKVEMEVDIKETEEIEDGVSQHKHKIKNKPKRGGGAI